MRYSKQVLDRIFEEEMKGDKSFTAEKTSIFELMLIFLFGEKKFTRKEAKDIWNGGIKLGIEIGLRRVSIDAQNVELSASAKDSHHLAFLSEYYALCDKYKCGIHFHPDHGVCVYTIQVPVGHDIWQTK